MAPKRLTNEIGQEGGQCNNFWHTITGKVSGFFGILILEMSHGLATMILN